MLRIRKALNNNVSIVRDDNKVDYLILGNGIAFGKKNGDTVNTEQIKEMYVVGKTDYQLLGQITNNITIEAIEAAQEIINFARKTLQAKFNANILLTLSDHISFALERIPKNQLIASPLDSEIRRLYKKEVEVGKKAKEIMEKHFQLVFPDSEEALIAMHFVNAQLDSPFMNDALIVTDISNQILDIVSKESGVLLDAEELTYSINRFLSHLKFFILKYLHNEKANQSEDSTMFRYLEKHFPETKRIVDIIDNYLKTNQAWEITNEDKMYLTIHINKLIGE